MGPCFRPPVRKSCRIVMARASLPWCSSAVDLNVLPKRYVPAQHSWLFSNVLLARSTLQASFESGKITQALLDHYFQM